MDKTSDSYKAGRAAFAEGLMYSDQPSTILALTNWDEWKAGYMDALVTRVRSLSPPK